MGFVRIPLHVYAYQSDVIRWKGLVLLMSSQLLLHCMPLSVPLMQADKKRLCAKPPGRLRSALMSMSLLSDVLQTMCCMTRGIMAA